MHNRGAGAAFEDHADAVHVPLHEMPAEAVGQAHGALQVDPVAGAQPTQGRAVERLLHDVGRERLPLAVGEPAGDGQTDPVDRDGRALADVLKYLRGVNDQPSGGRPWFDGRDHAEFLDDAGEHSCVPSRPGTTSETEAITRDTSGAWALDGPSAGLWAAGQHTPARVLPSGLSPSAPEFHRVSRPLAADGSRTVTAGSDFHRPRSARAANYLTKSGTRGRHRCKKAHAIPDGSTPLTLRPSSRVRPRMVGLVYPLLRVFATGAATLKRFI